MHVIGAEGQLRAQNTYQRVVARGQYELPATSGTSFWPGMP